MSNQQTIQEKILEKGLRPFGNKLRLAQTDDQYNVRLFLFADQADAKLYYNTFITYAEQNPPPFPFELILARIHTIFEEPFGLIFPNEMAENRTQYAGWFRDATLTCNETLRNFQSTDHNYGMLGRYVKELFNWTILIPASFDPDSPEGEKIFSDPPDGGYPPPASS